MSDDFDREAEKEELRRQLEAEEEAREATQHMSELLLKGATMTNKHCGECGDPIFRYQGEEFCPTCQRPVAEDGEPADDAAAGGAEAAETADGPADDPATGGSSADAAGTGGADDLAVETPGGNEDPTAAADSRAGETGSAGSASAPQSTASGSGAAGDAAGDLGAARAALVRTLTGLARQAEASDDVRRTRDYLAAAREAAEAIAALDATGR